MGAFRLSVKVADGVELVKVVYRDVPQFTAADAVAFYQERSGIDPHNFPAGEVAVLGPAESKAKIAEIKSSMGGWR